MSLLCNSKCHYHEATSSSLTPVAAYVPPSCTWFKTGIRAVIRLYWSLLNTWSVKLFKNETLVKYDCTKTKLLLRGIAQSHLRTVVIYNNLNVWAPIPFSYIFVFVLFPCSHQKPVANMIAVKSHKIFVIWNAVEPSLSFLCTTFRF